MRVLEILIWNSREDSYYSSSAMLLVLLCAVLWCGVVPQAAT